MCRRASALWLAFPAAVLLVAVMGAALHYFIIRPVLAAEPINQLLVTGGVLFLLQALATVIFGIDFRNIGVRMPGFNVGDMYFSSARLLAFVVALAAIGATWLVPAPHVHRRGDPRDQPGPRESCR